MNDSQQMNESSKKQFAWGVCATGARFFDLFRFHLQSHYYCDEHLPESRQFCASGDAQRWEASMRNRFAAAACEAGAGDQLRHTEAAEAVPDPSHLFLFLLLLLLPHCSPRFSLHQPYTKTAANPNIPHSSSPNCQGPMHARAPFHLPSST